MRTPKSLNVFPQSTFERKIGMDIVRENVRQHCFTETARTFVDRMKASADFAAVKRDLLLTHEMNEIMKGDRPLKLEGLADMGECLSGLKVEGFFIDVEPLRALLSSLTVIRDIHRRLTADATEKSGLTELAFTMMDVSWIIREIDRLLSPDGQIKDGASDALREIRGKLRTIEGRVRKAMRRAVETAVSQGVIEADAQPAIRDGRLVLPVSAVNRRKLPGIVQGESSTGKTVFIEPAEVVMLTNEQRELELEERREIVKILTRFADSLRPELPAITDTFRVVYLVDFIRAKALFAARLGGNMTDVVDYPVVEWFNARNPVLKLRLEPQGRQVVPLTLELSESTARILVISGPNAGGKSVALKTVGLNQYMAQCGLLPVMDANSRVGIFDGFFASLGDDQSIDDDLSTYSSHLKGMKYFLTNGTSRSLLLIDEFGSGTEPQIGGAIAQSLLEAFNREGMWGIVTTHYQNLKQVASTTPGLMNASMTYDRAKMEPTFRLTTGSPGSSFAIEIAQRTGLPKNILARAKEIVGDDMFNLDKYLLDINRDRRYWENKREEIKKREKHLEQVIERYEQNAETLRAQRREILAEAKTEAENIIARSNAAVERTIREIRRNQADREITKQLRSTLEQERQEIENNDIPENKTLMKAPRAKKKEKAVAKPKAEALEVGQNVLLDNQGQPGQILEINRDKAVVSFGALKMTVALDRLSPTLRQAKSGGKEKTSAVTTATIEASRKRQLSFSTEIDVRGMRADEAIQAVTYFIDDAVQFNAGRVRILHGTGTGALRMAVRQFLATVPAVVKFHDEDVRFGGAGITVVEL